MKSKQITSQDRLYFETVIHSTCTQENDSLVLCRRQFHAKYAAQDFGRISRWMLRRMLKDILIAHAPAQLFQSTYPFPKEAMDTVIAHAPAQLFQSTYPFPKEAMGTVIAHAPAQLFQSTYPFLKNKIGELS